MNTYFLEIQNFVKNSRGLSNAKLEANKWFLSKTKTGGETEVQKDNRIFMPGKIYIFKYKSDKKKAGVDSMGQEGPLYIAVVLSIGHVEGHDVGIDLNYIPDKQKLAILSVLYKNFKNEITSAEKINPGVAKTQRPIKDFTEDSLMKFAGRYGIGYAIRRYETKLRKDTYILAYETWKYLPLLSLNKSNSNLIKIQKGFNKYINKKK
jgi:hypothetical protein